jgi:DNA-binding NtrC family response regulator
VDDEPDLTFSFKEGLEDAGFNVDVFNDSMHALENFKPDFYDLVILDIENNDFPDAGGPTSTQCADSLDTIILRSSCFKSS